MQRGPARDRTLHWKKARSLVLVQPLLSLDPMIARENRLPGPTLRQVSPGKEDSFTLETFRREPCG